MSDIKMIAVDRLRDFITWSKDQYTRRITESGGGCETCGYGGWERTVGYETDFDRMFANLEDDIDEFSKTFTDNKE